MWAQWRPHMKTLSLQRQLPVLAVQCARPPQHQINTIKLKLYLVELAKLSRHFYVLANCTYMASIRAALRHNAPAPSREIALPKQNTIITDTPRLHTLPNSARCKTHATSCNEVAKFALHFPKPTCNKKINTTMDTSEETNWYVHIGMHTAPMFCA